MVQYFVILHKFGNIEPIFICSCFQSARSGSLLLTAANLAQIHQEQQDDKVDPTSIRNQNIQYYLQQTNQQDLISLPVGERKTIEPDNVSVASSMHFTVVNVNTSRKVPQRGFCRKHQLTILVVTMSFLFTVGIMTAILLLESKYTTAVIYNSNPLQCESQISGIQKFPNFFRILPFYSVKYGLVVILLIA